MKNWRNDQAIQAAAHALAEALRELVKEAVREEMASHVVAAAEVGRPAVEVRPEPVPRPREALVRMPELKRLTGMGTSSIYKYVAEAGFPEPLRMGERAVAWRWGEVADWLANRPRARVKPQPAGRRRRS